MIRDFEDYVISITYERGSNGDDNIRCIEVPLVDDEDIEPMEEFVGQLTTNDTASIPDNEAPITIIDNDGMNLLYIQYYYCNYCICRSTCEIQESKILHY